ncbi:MAG: hypothetical protein F6K21_26945 [Symploca sp. SIO2D2]|nr:hypothetical protein [Symploca sp. SIO2D2]
MKPKLEERREVVQVLQIMNAAEIIEEISRLPHEEKGKVVQFVREFTDEELEIAQAVKEGGTDIEAGRFKTQEEAEELFESWFGK